MRGRYASFRAFWPVYVREHAHPFNRALHFVGTSLAILSVLAAVVRGEPALALLAPLFGYGFAWTGHYFVQRNKPVTFEHPLYSLAADFVMYGRILTGTMAREVETARRGEGSAHRTG